MKWFTLIKWVSMGLVIAVIAWQSQQLSRAQAWEREIVGAVSHAADARDGGGNPVIIAKQDVTKYILALGQALTDVQRGAQLARAQDATNALTRERAAARTTKGIIDDYTLKIANARAVDDQRRGAQSGSLRTSPAPSAAHRGSGRANLPALPSATKSADDQSAQIRLSNAVGLSREDALICTEQAIGFDGLRSWVSAQAAVANGDARTTLPD